MWVCGGWVGVCVGGCVSVGVGGCVWGDGVGVCVGVGGDGVGGCVCVCQKFPLDQRVGQDMFSLGIKITKMTSNNKSTCFCGGIKYN